MFSQLQLFVYILLLFFNIAIRADESIGGSCVNFNFSLDKENIDTSTSVRVLRQGAPVYQDEKGTVLESKSLEFGEAVLPLKISQPRQRIQIARYGSLTTPLGWMNEWDLLCANTPLTNEKNLARKAVINIPIDTKPDYSITAYPSPDSQQCDIKCNHLTKFEVYFIFDEYPLNCGAKDPPNCRRYLLAKDYILSVPYSPDLIGWVEADQVIPWNTRLGLRPKEHVNQIQGYYEKNDALLKGNDDPSKGVILEGKKIWYTFPYHIPILDIDKEKKYYFVAAPGVGITGFKPVATDTLNVLKQVDVFFLLDGTASMGPYIKAAKESAQKITNELHNHPDFKETSFRCGFRVYRDEYADNRDEFKKICQKGICEGMPLSADTCQLDTERDNCQEVADQMGKIKATEDDDDGYAERLFDGLVQSLRDINTCSQRTKLLFVIGDHGDKEEKVPQKIVKGLNDAFNRALLFFIQTPDHSSQARHQGAYKVMYQRFKDQAYYIVDQLLPKEYQGKAISREDYLLSLTTATELSQKVIDNLSLWSNSARVNDTQLRLSTGESLQSIIAQQLQARQKDNKTPIMFWQWVEQAACQALGEQCEKPIQDRVTTFYIPTDPEKIQQEVVMIGKHIDQWLSLLNSIIDLTPGLSATEQKNTLIRILKQEIQSLLGDPPLEEKGKTLAEQLMSHKRGLPIYEDSPLLQYELQEIRDMSQCELDRLLSWMRTVQEIFTKIKGSPTMKVSVEFEDYPNNCFDLSDKGQKFKQVKVEQKEKLGPNDSYRYGHALTGRGGFGGVTLYWLPVEFMP